MIQTYQFVIPIPPAHVKRDRIRRRVKNQAIRSIEMNLRKRVRILGHQLAQSDGILNSPAAGRSRAAELLGPKTGEQREVDAFSWPDFFKNYVVRVHIIELSQGHDRFGSALLHLNHDATRKLATH